MLALFIILETKWKVYLNLLDVGRKHVVDYERIRLEE